MSGAADIPDYRGGSGYGAIDSFNPDRGWPPVSAVAIDVVPAHPAAARLAPAPVRRLIATVAQCPVTLLLVGLLLVTWVAERALIGRQVGAKQIGYLAFGALPNAVVAGRGSPADLWRFVGAALVHDETVPIQIAVNVAALFVVGSAVERLLGRAPLIAAVVLGSIVGNATWLVASSLGYEAVPEYVLGASTAICALVGLLLVQAYGPSAGGLQRERLRLRSWAVLALELIVLASEALPHQDLAAHLGALVTGAALGAALLPRPRRSGRPRRIPTGATVGVVVVGGASVVAAAANLVDRLLGG